MKYQGRAFKNSNNTNNDDNNKKSTQRAQTSTKANPVPIWSADNKVSK